MKHILLAVAAMLLVGEAATGAEQRGRGRAKPTSAPTSQPAPTRTVAQAEGELHKVEAAALNKFRLTDGYKTKKAKADADQKHLQKARQSGTPEERLAASHDYVSSLQDVKDAEQGAVFNDPDYQVASKALAQSRAEEIAAKDQEENAPSKLATREGRIIIGMSESEAEKAFGNRKGRNIQPIPQSGVAIDMNGAQAKGLPTIRPIEVVKKVRDDAVGKSRITFTRYTRYMNGSEYAIDEIVVIFANGKAIEVDGQ